jgi:hypothetical protein
MLILFLILTFRQALLSLSKAGESTGIYHDSASISDPVLTGLQAPPMMSGQDDNLHDNLFSCTDASFTDFSGFENLSFDPSPDQYNSQHVLATSFPSLQSQPVVNSFNTTGANSHTLGPEPWTALHATRGPSGFADSLSSTLSGPGLTSSITPATTRAYSSSYTAQYSKDSGYHTGSKKSHNELESVTSREHCDIMDTRDMNMTPMPNQPPRPAYPSSHSSTITPSALQHGPTPSETGQSSTSRRRRTQSNLMCSECGHPAKTPSDLKYAFPLLVGLPS